MTVLITLTTAGTDTGPFNLYSDVNNYAYAFVLNVTKQQLTEGYPSDLVPDGTTIVKVQSVNSSCNNFTLLNVPTTTTTTTTLNCSFIVNAQEVTTTTTTTTAAPTTTTTTTLEVFTHGLQQSSSYCVGGFCELDGTINNITVYSVDETLVAGSYIYTNPALTIPYTTELVSDGQYLFNVSSLGQLSINCTVGIEC